MRVIRQRQALHGLRLIKNEPVLVQTERALVLRAVVEVAVGRRDAFLFTRILLRRVPVAQALSEVRGAGGEPDVNRYLHAAARTSAGG